MKLLTQMVKSLCIAFSLFSKLPVPQFAWKEEDMKYMLLFFPFVGIVIGGVAYVWWLACNAFSIGSICFALVGTAIPVLLSGGIHADGYMDTMDALHSYQPKEKKLEICKDPHTGAFSVIWLFLYYLLYAGAYSELNSARALLLLGTGYWLSRILSALGSVCFPCAKKDGLIYLFSGQSDKAVVRSLLSIQLLACGAVLLCLSYIVGSALIVMSALTLLFYRYQCEKEFGGITGDTAGYFTMLCEGGIAAVTAVGCAMGLL